MGASGEEGSLGYANAPPATHNPIMILTSIRDTLLYPIRIVTAITDGRAKDTGSIMSELRRY